MNETGRPFWRLEGEGIRWDIEREDRLPHRDHLEMSGARISQHIAYEVGEDRSLRVVQTLVWPGLRLIPNDTHGSMKVRFEGNVMNPVYTVDGSVCKERLSGIFFDGIFRSEGWVGESIRVTREYYPGQETQTAYLRLSLENRGSRSVQVKIRMEKKEGTTRGVYGINYFYTEIRGETEFCLEPGGESRISLCCRGRRWVEREEECDADRDFRNRREFLRRTGEALMLETPDPVLNREFAFAKIRSSESVFMTRAGLLHSPGGLHYYGAVWTNDQVEYAGPFFACLGMEKPIEASVNAYRMYIPFMGPGYECIPSSIVAEGNDIWEGKKDRGDCAMYAYGASRFALIRGDRRLARELFPAVKWCLEYSRRQINSEGVIRSDSDELEGRFPAGTANLATSCLVYEGLRTAAVLADELGEAETAGEYRSWRTKLGGHIEEYFGRSLKGYDTYRYCDAGDDLRSWICIPLTMGIFTRKKGTVEALLSPHLWTENGLATMEGDTTFWDRSTLYGLRGIFCAGEAEEGLSHLREYSGRRLLGDHVPYPVEAWPEGDQRHLSAESALYCRIYLEGILGMLPEGLNCFSLCPSLPEKWDQMQMKNICGFGKTFDLRVERSGADGYRVTVKEGEKEQVYITQKGKKIEIRWEKR